LIYRKRIEYRFPTLYCRKRPRKFACVTTSLLITNRNDIINYFRRTVTLIFPVTALISVTGRRTKHATHPLDEEAQSNGKTHGIEKKKKDEVGWKIAIAVVYDGEWRITVVCTKMEK
jgi:hypothetical protein